MDKKIDPKIILLGIVYIVVILFWTSNCNLSNQAADLKSKNEALRRDLVTCKGQLEEVIYTYENCECGDKNE